MARALVNVPKEAKRGDAVEVKVLIQHPMETGYRTGPDGRLVPRDIVNRLVATYDGEEVFAVDLFPAIAANPFFAFPLLATASGTITIAWTDDKGQSQVETARITVT